MVEHLILRPTLYVGESCSATLYWGVRVGWGVRRPLYAIALPLLGKGCRVSGRLFIHLYMA